MMGTATERLMERQGWPRLGRFWTVPNILTLSRLVLVVGATWLILTDGSMTWLFTLIILAIATDWFDGHVARWSHTVSEWGKVLDPLVDKLGAGVIVLALFIKGWLPAWFLILLVARDLCILAGGVILAKKTGRIVVSMWSGKVAVTAVAVTVLAALLQADPPIMDFCVWVTAGLLVYSYLRYMVRYFRLLRSGPLPPMEVDVVADPETGGMETA